MRFRAPSDRIFLIPPAQHTNDVAVQRRSAPAALLGATIGTVVRTAQAKEKQSFGVIAESIRVRDRTLVHIEDDENGAAVSALSLPLLPLGAASPSLLFRTPALMRPSISALFERIVRGRSTNHLVAACCPLSPSR